MISLKHGQKYSRYRLKVSLVRSNVRITLLMEYTLSFDSQERHIRHSLTYMSYNHFSQIHHTYKVQYCIPRWRVLYFLQSAYICHDTYSSSTFYTGLSRSWSTLGGTFLAVTVRIGIHLVYRRTLLRHSNLSTQRYLTWRNSSINKISRRRRGNSKEIADSVCYRLGHHIAATTIFRCVCRRW